MKTVFIPCSREMVQEVKGSPEKQKLWDSRFPGHQVVFLSKEYFPNLNTIQVFDL